MIVLKIEKVKEFMGLLLTGDMFDKFRVSSCEVTTFVTLQTDGKRNDDWYDSDEREEDASGLVSWQQLKPVVFSLIKGTKTPEKMKIDFCHYMENGDVGSIRMQFEKGDLMVYTGYMQREFSLDKDRQQAWDENCINFIKKNNIASTQVD